MKNELLDFRITKTVSNGYTRFRIQKMIDGTKINVTGKTKKEVIEKFYKKLEELDNNSKALDFDLNNITFADFTKYYLYDVVEPAGSIKGSTFCGYASHYKNHIKNSNLAKVKLIDVKTKDLQQFYNVLSKKDLKLASIQSIKKFISTIINYAVKNDYTVKNYNNNVKLKQDVDVIRKHKFLNSSETNILLNSCDDKVLKMIIYLILNTGLRINEALALTTDDIKDNILNVNKNIERSKNGNVIGTPKTRTSIRKIPINNSLQKELDMYVSYITEERLKVGISINNNNTLFLSRSYKRIHSSSLVRNLNILYNKCGIDTSGFHTLRHTFGSTLYEKGIDIKTISELLGHSDINITSQIYIHLAPNKKEKAINVLNF